MTGGKGGSFSQDKGAGERRRQIDPGGDAICWKTKRRYAIFCNMFSFAGSLAVGGRRK